MSAATDSLKALNAAIDLVEESLNKPRRPHYVRIPQNRDLEWKHINDVPVDFYLYEHQKPGWAEGIFRVEPDGSLKLIEHDWDST